MERAEPEDGRRSGALVVSAQGGDALRAQAHRLRARMAERPELRWADVASTLVRHRSVHGDRAVVLPGPGGPDAALRALAAGEPHADVVTGRAAARGRTVWVFPGQGSQWAGMASGLMAESPVFAERMRACAEVVDPLVGWSLLEMVESPPDRADVVQPVLFSVMVSLAAVWQSWGQVPDAVVGHSQGELAAAHVAGALSLADAAGIIVRRSRIVEQKLAGRGGMLAVALPAEQVSGMLENGGAELAVVNSASSVVVSGPTAALERLVERCAADDVRTRWIPVDYPSHSVAVDELREDLSAALSGTTGTTSRIPFLSTVTADWLDTAEMDGDYWFRNLRRSVRFEQGVRALAAAGYSTFLEVSPHPVLTSAVEETVGPDAVVAGSLRRGSGGTAQLVRSLAELWVRGAAVDWSRVVPEARFVDVPTYPFQRTRMWLSGGSAPPSVEPTEHPWLNSVVELVDGLVLDGRVSARDHEWLGGHVVAGAVLLPGSAYAEMASVVGHRVGLPVVRELTVLAPVVLDRPRSLQITAGPLDEQGRRPVRLHSRPEDDGASGWTLHAEGVLCERDDAEVPPAWRPGEWPPAAEPMPLDHWYDLLAERGYDYGPEFRGVRWVRRRGDEIFAEVALPPGVEQGGFLVHPALLDAALQPLAALAAGSDEDGAVRLPFAWSGLTLHAGDVRELRVRLDVTDPERISVHLADQRSEPLGAVSALALRPVSPAQMAGRPAELSRLAWEPVGGGFAPATRAVPLSDVATAPDDGAPAPDLVYVASAPAEAGPARDRVLELSGLLRDWLADERFASTRLVVVTDGGVAVEDHERVDPGAAAVWSLVRSAQPEHPDRLFLLDLDEQVTASAVTAALTGGGSRVAVRAGVAYQPVLVPVPADEDLPATGWCLAAGSDGSIGQVGPAHSDAADRPLERGQVRIAVRAAGLNFRDVVLTVGLVDQHGLGSEGAGVVQEVGPGVEGLTVGDRVLGMFPSAFGPVAVADARMLVRMPAAWSFVDGAAVPAAFLTAFHSLVDVAGVRSGESVLVHAAAGGVGTAAVQLAAALGAVVYGTASPHKWAAARARGARHLSSSRSVGFRDEIREATGGRGVDVVLNSLRGEFVDASLDLLVDGGRFVELGKTDVRATDAAGPGGRYHVVDLADVEPERIGVMLAEIVDMIADGRLSLPPVGTWDVRRARDAFRVMSRARHIGKIVLTLPRRPDPDGVVLITGGTGTVGATVARHLVAERGARRMVLVSRRGADAPGASDLAAELTAAGADVTIVACDVADRDRMTDVVETHRPTAVVHAAGTLDDALVTGITAEQVERVWRSKVDGARVLDEVTRDLDPPVFLLFSSFAGVAGSPGQGNYAAANAVLDTVARRRRATGRAGTSVAWGLWNDRSEMTARLTPADLQRLRRMGIRPMSTSEALTLLDRVWTCPDRTVVAAGLTDPAGRPVEPPVDGPAVDDPAGTGVGGLNTLSPEERATALRDMVRSHAAAVLGHPSVRSVSPDRAFTEIGFDSLTAVELRNRLRTATGVELASTVVFDYPNVAALAGHLGERLAPADRPMDALLADVDRWESTLAGVVGDAHARHALGTRLRSLLRQIEGDHSAEPAALDLDAATDDELFDLVEKKLG